MSSFFLMDVSAKFDFFLFICPTLQTELRCGCLISFQEVLEGGDSNSRDDVVDVTETPTSMLAGKKAIVGLQDVDPINIDAMGTFTQIEREIHEV